ncbi:MAG: YhdH/YhfP family quinone oxidoreductase [Alkalispirochaetaceae bacterium]
MKSFRALRVYREGNSCRSVVETCSPADLGTGEILLRVRYSSLNYKDALSATGAVGVTRHYPHTPGIDAVGEVLEGSGLVEEGSSVIATGYDLGVNSWGGYSELLRLPADWTLPLPAGLSLREAAALGTAGLTAALAVTAIEESLEEPEAPILVTGATGGVGSLATAILTRIGRQVEAVSGKPRASQVLAPVAPEATVLSREELHLQPDRPLLSARWSGAVDTVGGAPLASLLRGIRYGGSVAACGNAAATAVETTVLPFILRAVRLIGIDSVAVSRDLRRQCWDRLAGVWKPRNLDSLISEVSLEELPDYFDRILRGEQTGRTVVRI